MTIYETKQQDDDSMDNQFDRDYVNDEGGQDD